MASHRPYRPGLGLEVALAEIEATKGKLYDAKVVDACVRLFRVKGMQLPMAPSRAGSDVAGLDLKGRAHAQ
jgi:HD-GYP domain-containing protein (c-di-GMP phosphodiesterase class II)